MSRDDDHRVVDVPLQGGRNRAEDVVVAVLGPTDDEEHPGVGAVPQAQLVRHRDQVVRDRAVTALEVPALRGLQAGVGQLAEMLDAGHLLLYSSDYPHHHGNDALQNLLAALTEEDREAVLWGNAAAFFDIGVAAAS